MPAFMDLTGRSFSRWAVLGHPFFEKGQFHWLCRCSCGVEKRVSGGNLRNGATKSCGCWNLEQLRQPKKHGMSKTREFRNWVQMIERCHNPKIPCFKRYGGRGIAVCDRWRYSFANFLSDMGLRPEGLTIERINNDGNYEPGNCRWATNLEQQRNKRSNRIVQGFGRNQLLIEWSRELQISASLLHYHLKHGRTLEQISASH